MNDIKKEKILFIEKNQNLEEELNKKEEIIFNKENDINAINDEMKENELIIDNLNKEINKMRMRKMI